MTDDELLAAWRRRWDEPTSGWDFSGFGDRLTAQEPPWSYSDLARSALRGAHSVLDIGTGGGEVLRGLVDALPLDTVATEGWPPNLPVAQESLLAYGVPVIAYDADAPDPTMPFPDGRFDVVLARHESYHAPEVARVLAPGGRFVTQQVDGRSYDETRALFGGPNPLAGVTLGRFRAQAEAVGLEVAEALEWWGAIRFADVATFVSYVRMVPWTAPDDFSVERYSEVLLQLHHRGQELAFSQGRFALVCRRPGTA